MTIYSLSKKSILCSLVLSLALATSSIHSGLSDWFTSASDFISKPENNGFVIGSLLCIGAALVGTYYYYFQKNTLLQPKNIKPVETPSTTTIDKNKEKNEIVSPPSRTTIEEEEERKEKVDRSSTTTIEKKPKESNYTEDDLAGLSMSEIVNIINSLEPKNQTSYSQENEFPIVTREECLKSEIISSKERTARNAERLQNTEHRVFNIPDNCQGMSEHLIIGRALRQPDGWSCGPHCLFTAQLISGWLDTGTGAKEFNDHQEFIDYDGYNAKVFQSWYTNTILAQDVFGKRALNEHEVSGLLCPQHLYDGSQQQNYLQSPKICSVADSFGLENQFFVLSAPFVADPKTPLELHIENGDKMIGLYYRDNSSDYLTESSEYLRAVVDAFKNENYTSLEKYNFPKVDYHLMPALYFFCNINNHWVLIVAAKCNDDVKLILLDPKNELDTQEQLSYESNLNDTTARLLSCLYQICTTPFDT